jgi:hypothetical protein
MLVRLYRFYLGCAIVYRGRGAGSCIDRRQLSLPLAPASVYKLIPADLPPFILFFEPALQRLEVFGHGPRGNIFAGCFL